MTRGRKLGLLLLALAALLVLTIVVMELAPDGEGTEEATAVTIFTLDPDQVTSRPGNMRRRPFPWRRTRRTTGPIRRTRRFPWTSPIRMRWCRP